MRRIFTSASVVFALCALSTAATAQQTKTVDYGRTTVTLDPGFVSAVQSLGLQLGVIEPTQLKDGRVNFPIIGGNIDLATAKGEIIHSGGLTLSAGSTTVNLQSFTIDTTSTPVLTGLVTVSGTFAGRLPLFNIQLPAGLTLPLTLSPGRLLILKGVGLTLNATAATTLNQVFNTTGLPTDGTFVVGTANVVGGIGEPQNSGDGVADSQN